MPYVITTTPRRQDPHALHYDHHADICAPDITRTAVATLDEARGIAFCVTPGGVAEALNLPANGGTVGPLPDGTVIEVRPIEWADLPPIAEARKRYPHGPAREAVLRDFNAGAR